MSTINYPIDQDKSIETWTLTSSQAQMLYFEQVYGIAQCSPVNYNQILTQLLNLEIPFAPLREYVYISQKYSRATLNSENNNANQSEALATAMIQLTKYWIDQIIPNFGYPLGVVTEMSSEVIQDNEVSPAVADFHLVIRLKIQWFQVNLTKN
jgi:hypothetical protein